ncbi:hypothetical protein EGJ27_08665 [Pseudomonas sp. v388]|uniref:hypothetical protein n=1 Tax=Pseudomonas sp. v388 TaxID=2479849 RepID=UPI000F78CA26|nr:hypothetical protein [Pseudomonas sp. v388]RRV08117.1 hypothetical protein EGJ27_08665 [Pseudomonas sp. v388]
MKTFIYKAKTTGQTLRVAESKSVLKLHHLLIYFPNFPERAGRKFDISKLIGQVTLVHYIKTPFGEVKKPNHVQVVSKRVSHAIDVSSAIFTARLREEQDGLMLGPVGGDVNQRPLSVLPDSVELSFDVKIGDLPNGPAVQLFSLMSDNMLWDSVETFTDWLAGQRFMRDNEGRLVLDY